MKTEKALINVCQEIGGIAESNCHFTAGLAGRIEYIGITVEEMTVGELLKLAREHSDFYQRVHGGEK